MTEYYDEYRKMRNKVQREIKHAKQHYLVNKIDDTHLKIGSQKWP